MDKTIDNNIQNSEISEFSNNSATKKRLNKIERRIYLERIRLETYQDKKRKTNHHNYTRAQIDLDAQKSNKVHKAMIDSDDEQTRDMEDVDNPGLSTVNVIDVSDDEELQLITIPEDEKDKPLTAGSFIDALNKQTKNLSDMHTKTKDKLYKHMNNVTSETMKNTNKIAEIQKELKDMRDTLHDTVDHRLQKQLEGQLTFEFRRKLENDITRTKKNIMFYSVTDSDRKTPEEIIREMIEGLTLADRQIDSVKNMVITLDPSSTLNRTHKTRNVRVAFANIDDKKAVWIALIKETKIKWPVKMRDDFSDDYKSKAKEFERKLKNLKNIQGGKTELVYDGVELQARQTINDVTNICLRFTPTDPNFKVKSQVPTASASSAAPKPMTNIPIDQQTKEQNNKSVVVNIKPDVTDTDRISAIQAILINLFVNSNTPAVSAKKGNKCFLVLFGSVKDANEASKHINGLNPKPFNECKFTYVPRL